MSIMIQCGRHAKNLRCMNTLFRSHVTSLIKQTLAVSYADCLRLRHLCSSASPSSSPRKLPVLTLYTKQPCPLCDEALHHLKHLLDQVILEKVDITTPANIIWWKAYRYDIPVFHLNGKFLMKHKADLGVLETALNDFNKDTNSS